MTEKVIYCQSCGAENPAEARFCHNCGGSINITDAGQIKEESNTAAVVLGYILSIFGAGIGIIVSIYLQTRDNPDSVMHGRVQASIFGIWMLIFGQYINIILAIIGIAIIMIMLYLLIRDRPDEHETAIIN